MDNLAPLPAQFFERPPADVARGLLGCRLLSRLGGALTGGTIVETEAYGGLEDQASHARRGPTERNRVMFGPPGMAYVYLIYGLHWCLNAVTGTAGSPSAVLIRAILPETGRETIGARRGKAPEPRWTDGPAKLCQALAITGAQNGEPLFDSNSRVWITAGSPVPEDQVIYGPRVGVDYAPEPWRSLPWRLRWVKGPLPGGG